MTIYENVRSTKRPSDIEIKETLVFKASNIHEVIVDDPMTEDSKIEFEYTLTEYTKDEYILKTNADLDFIAMELGVDLDD